MATKMENNDEESFIILGTSPGSSLDMKCNGVANGDTLDKAHLEDAMKDLPVETNMAFKAHFKLADCPSPASMMVASTIVSEDKSTEELQKSFGELLDENVILKETLKQNNESMKEQFLLIASCQEDMMKTHMVHKEKFDETRQLVEKLRQENKKLKQDILKLTVSAEPSQVNNETGEHNKSGPSSALEFVTSPEDDTVDKLTAQLELVEKQRREVIIHNEKLSWQKESLEHIVDAVSKERDDLKEKLKHVELLMSTKENDYLREINKLKARILELDTQLQSSNSINSISTEEVKKRDEILHQTETKLTSLQTDLKNAQLRILDLENVKLEFSRHKSGVAETIKIYKDQIQDLNNKLKEAQTTVFQPVRFSISSESEGASTEYGSLLSNVKLYDRTLKHISEFLNALTHGMSNSIVQTMGLVISLQDFNLDKTTAEQFKSALADVKKELDKILFNALNNIGQMKSTMTIFEGIFKDYNELLKKTVTKQESKPSPAVNVEDLTKALVARGQEVQMLEAEMKKLRGDKEDVDVLKAQLDLYKSDFEAERESREKMACEKENIATDLRTAQRRIQDLTRQLEETRKQGSTQTSKTPRTSSASAPRSPQTPTSGPSSNTSTGTTGNVVRKKKKISHDETKEVVHETTPPPLRFNCPVCDKPFKSLILLQQHVDTCLL